jgi:hypothetical protein
MALSTKRFMMALRMLGPLAQIKYSKLRVPQATCKFGLVLPPLITSNPVGRIAIMRELTNSGNSRC